MVAQSCRRPATSIQSRRSRSAVRVRGFCPSQARASALTAWYSASALVPVVDPLAVIDPLAALGSSAVVAGAVMPAVRAGVPALLRRMRRRQ